MQKKEAELKETGYKLIKDKGECHEIWGVGDSV
jgi:hypothetical protein